MNSETWQPTADIDVLKKRSRLLLAIRAYFASAHVTEVEVPAMGTHSVTDPYLDAISVELGSGTHYLQTSPEYFMKRLLAAGSGPIYSLAKAFRADELGRNHRPEFTMLEWYRPGFDDKQLIEDVIQLLRSLKPDIQVKQTSYAEVFKKHTGLDPHKAGARDLEHVAHNHLDLDWQHSDKNTWLDLLFSHLVEPNLGPDVHVVFDFPATQCALARVVAGVNGVPVARRFEVYWGGLELANGYWELTDAAEQQRRFASDNQMRASLGKVRLEPDPQLLAAMRAGLPECAGVALGVDRLIMALLELDHIDKQSSF